MSIEKYELDDLKGIIEKNSRVIGDKPAFLFKDIKGTDYQEITFSKFKDDVNALGTKLLDLGLKGEKIAVIGSNCYSWVVSYFATVCGVGVVVPLDKELSLEEVINLLKRSDSKAVFFTEEFIDIFKDLNIEYKFVMKQFVGEESVPAPGCIDFESLIQDGNKLLIEGRYEYVNTKIDPQAVNMLIYTSGTTGDAKGVMLTHKNIVSNARDITKIVKVHNSDRALSILPIHHTFESNIGIITSMYCGASVAFGEGLKYIAKNLAEAKVTMLVGVPLIFESMYAKIWKEAEKSGRAMILRRGIKLNRTLKAMGINQEKKIFKSIYSKFGGKLRMLITGAAAIDPKVIRGFEDLGIMVLQGYGLTECSPLVSGTPEHGNRYKHTGSVGPSVDSGEIRIIDSDEEGIGEIIFRGPSVMKGYYGMPEETAEVLKDGWFYTGDLGFLNSEGWLYITGRKKNVLVTKTGKNIYPEEIETYLKTNRYIEEVIVYGKEKEDDKEKNSVDGISVSAIIKPNFEYIAEKKGDAFIKNDDEDMVYNLIKKTIDELNEGLPVYKKIRSFTIRYEDFVMTTTKKIKRHENI